MHACMQARHTKACMRAGAYQLRDLNRFKVYILDCESIVTEIQYGGWTIVRHVPSCMWRFYF